MPEVGIFEQAAINMGRGKANQARALIRQYAATSEPQLRAKIVDVFAPQIERRAAAAAAASKGKISAVDYAQDLYLKFLEALEEKKSQYYHPVSEIVNVVNNKKPNVDTLITLGGKPIQHLSPEEFNELSYKPGDKTINQKVLDIINSVKIPFTEKNILNFYLEGYSFGEIAKFIGLTKEKVVQIYQKAVENIKKSENAHEIFYEDDKGTISKSNLREFVQRELNILLKFMYGAHVFSTQDKKPWIYHFFKESDRMIRLELPKNLNTDLFKAEAEKLSMEYYGRNILEFI